MDRRRTFLIFNGSNVISTLLRQNSEAIEKEVNNADEDYILNVDESEYSDYFLDKYRLEPLVIHIEEGFSRARETEIPNKEVDFGRYVSKRVQVIIFKLPYEGNHLLFHYRPESQDLNWSQIVFLEDDYLCFEIFDEGYPIEEINAEAREIKNKIIIQNDNLTNDILAYNKKIAIFVKDCVRHRKKALLEYKKKREGLEIPFRKRDNVPETFEIPSLKKKRKVKVEKPTARQDDYEPEPTLSQSDYSDVLKLIYGAGREFERYPNTFSSMYEGDLRNVLIVLLQTHFEGAATAETFNMEGKSDILLKHEGGVAFVAECKFWGGPKKYSETIDQILRYLTWRDSKAAIIVFVRGTDMSTVISKISETTSKHGSFISEKAKGGESWFNFEIAINNDVNTKASLAVLLFQIPL